MKGSSSSSLKSGFWLALLLSLAFCSIAFAEYRFQGLGDLSGGNIASYAYGVSANGTVVVGVGYSSYGTEAFRWTEADGMVGLGDLAGGNFESVANGVSADGNVVVGRSRTASGNEAFRWTQAGMVGLGDLEGGEYRSIAYDASGDGSVVVGYSSSTAGMQAFRWTEAGMVGLGDLPGGDFYSEARGVSADGAVVVGVCNAYGMKAFRWTETEGMVTLGTISGGSIGSSWANAISADGSVIVGLTPYSNNSTAFRWTETEGIVGLGDLPGGSFESEAYATSADGSVVVGYGQTGTDVLGRRAFIWDAAHGMRNLKEVLVNEGGLELTGWDLIMATGISDDGRTIVGHGYHWVNNSVRYEAWLAELPSSYCYDFTVTYDNAGAGDSYSGVFYDHHYYAIGANFHTFADENGLAGHYVITGRNNSDSGQEGQVFVTSYYDAESGETLTPVHAGYAVGAAGLGSEMDYVLQDGNAIFRFGFNSAAADKWTDRYEADVFYRYDFTCSYNNGAGDAYQGVFYSYEPFSVNQTLQPFMDENYAPGYYTITGKALAGDAGLNGQVLVTTYYNRENDTWYDPVHIGAPVGTEGLGSEEDYIILADVPEYRFGRKNYEADLVAYRYDFTFSYGNYNSDGKSDYYTGQVYAAPEYGYQEGYRLQVKDENGLTGGYVIGRATPGYDPSLAGQVTVDQYYDVEMNKFYIPTWARGTNYLGSEFGYIVIANLPDSTNFYPNYPPGITKFLFGLGYNDIFYEADVKKD